MWSEEPEPVEIEVSITEASLRDVVRVVYDCIDEPPTEVTLGEEIAHLIVARMAADHNRWEQMTEHYTKAVARHLRGRLPGYARDVVEREVRRQLEDVGRAGAMTRGEPSTMAAAMVATEVTTQLRARFEGVVIEALDNLELTLARLSAEAVDEFISARVTAGAKRGRRR